MKKSILAIALVIGACGIANAAQSTITIKANPMNDRTDVGTFPAMCTTQNLRYIDFKKENTYAYPGGNRGEAVLTGVTYVITCDDGQ